VATPSDVVADIHAAQIEKRLNLPILLMRDGTSLFQALNLRES
jgi:hypothetical protein